MNKAILIGNLTRDPEVRTTGSGTTVCTFTIAVNRRFQNQAGERVSDFFNIVAWRQLGELCGKYLSKGRRSPLSARYRTAATTRKTAQRDILLK